MKPVLLLNGKQFIMTYTISQVFNENHDSYCLILFFSVLAAGVEMC